MNRDSRIVIIFWVTSDRLSKTEYRFCVNTLVTCLAPCLISLTSVLINGASKLLTPISTITRQNPRWRNSLPPPQKQRSRSGIHQKQEFIAANTLLYPYLQTHFLMLSLSFFHTITTMALQLLLIPLLGFQSLTQRFYLW